MSGIVDSTALHLADIAIAIVSPSFAPGIGGTVSDVTVWMGLVGTAFVLTAVGVAAYELTEGRKGKETGKEKGHPGRRSRSGDRFERLKRPFRDPIGVLVAIFGLFGAFVIVVFLLGL